MLTPIKDCKQHIVCYADPNTGLIESKYKHQTTKTKLSLGGEFSITRDNTETIIKRTDASRFEIRSNVRVA